MGSNVGPTRAAGVYAALLTPREHESTEADSASFLEYVDRVSAARVDGLVLFGSTGEFVHYGLEERMRAVSLAVKRSRIPVLVNVSHSSLQGALTLAGQALETGASGLLLMPPYFYQYADTEVEQFYLDFLAEAATDLPVYLYSLPAFTTPLSHALTDRLLRSGAFTGIKESDGDWKSFKSLLALKSEVPFQAMAGNESIYIQARQSGADGIISGIAAALPELLIAIDGAIRTANASATESCGLLLRDFLSWVRRLPPTVAIKYAAHHRSWLPVELAVPLGPATLSVVNEFRRWLDAWLPETLARCTELTHVRT